MLYIVLMILLMSFCSAIDESDKQTLKVQRKKPFAALIFSNNIKTTGDNKAASCQWLSRLKHQSKLCWRRRGLSEALLAARKLAINYCEQKFKYEQWNCSSTDNFFKKIYRESAFMHSMASSAVMYSIARACSEGTLAGCKCGDHGKMENDTTWQWGGCGDNSKYAKTFTKKFLQLRKKGDALNTVIKYNAEMGIKVVLENEERFCRCHGVSGSCGVKICWKKIRSFDVISEQLKLLYHNAVQVESKNSVRSLLSGKKARKLLFMENSPNFCPTTANRICKNTHNCATLCCGRGFYSGTRQVLTQCNCSWRDKETLVVHCQKCPKNETVFKCK